MGKLPLVSVIVVSYNAEKTITETLDSIKAQTYGNIELVISDDCSKDNTINVIDSWVTMNKDRFARVEIVLTPINTGVSANLNRAIRKCEGAWVKTIAADDLLCENCVEDYMNYVIDNPEAKIVFGNYCYFHTDSNTTISNIYSDKTLQLFKLCAEDQLRLFLSEYREIDISAPSMFVNKDLLDQYPFNEAYRYEEDYPEWISLLKNGVTLYYLDKEVIKYRKADSLCQLKSRLAPDLMNNSQIPFFYLDVKPLMQKYGLTEQIRKNELRYARDIICVHLLGNKVTFVNRIIDKIITKILQ